MPPGGAPRPRAPATVHRQQAQSGELRAAVHLACEWRARHYGGLPEGVDTADLHEARALLAALFAPGNACAGVAMVPSGRRSIATEDRSLGRTGVHVSALWLGGMLFGEQTDEAEALMLIDRALDAGLHFVDTANIYSRGRSEEIIGRALQRNRRGWC
jgi:Aldo/keto reductase family